MQESQLICQNMESQAVGSGFFNFLFYINLKLQYCFQNTDQGQGLILWKDVIKKYSDDINEALGVGRVSRSQKTT